MVSVTMDRRLGLKPKRNETVVASLLLVISSVQLVLAVPALAAGSSQSSSHAGDGLTPLRGAGASAGAFRQALHRGKVAADDGAAFDYFGVAVDVSGDTAIVGAHRDDTLAGEDAGSAYIFVLTGTTWTQQAKLTAPDGDEFDYFGGSVAIEGDIAVVGAGADDSQTAAEAGSAYVFMRTGTTWSLETKLSPPGASDQDYFGAWVSLSGETLVVGAYGDDSPAGISTGSAYVFVHSGTTWTFQAKLLANDGAADDYFGYTVAADGDTAVVGAWRADTPGGTDAGAAYAFTRSGTSWTQESKLIATDGIPFANFGFWVDIAGDRALVGAPADDGAVGTDVGSAYTFVRSGGTWTQEAKLTASDGEAADQFGVSVALEADVALIGAMLDDNALGGNAGAAYVFVRSGTTWIQRTKLTASDGGDQDRFGYAVAADPSAAIVSAYGDDTQVATDVGSAYLIWR